MPNLRGLTTEVSREHPLFILGGSGPADTDPESAYKLWKLIPDELKEYSVYPVEHFSVETMERWAKFADKNDFPLLWQVRTWVPVWHRMWNNGMQGPGVGVDKVERLLSEHDSIKGVQICELNCFGLSTEERLYVSDLLKACARQGRYLSWREGNDGCNIWVDAFLEKWFSDDVEAYGRYLFPQWEMNIPRNMYLCHDSVFGLWMAGFVENWGLEPQSFYWLDCGFTDLNKPGENNNKGWREGDRSKFPRTMWGQMILLGMNSGATVYNFEPRQDVLFTDEGAYPPAAHEVLFPLLEDIVRERLIPSKEEVAEKVKVAYVADFEDRREGETSDIDYYRGFAPDNDLFGRHGRRLSGSGSIYKGTYGLAHEYKMIPDTGRYYWIPVLPKYTRMEVMNRFERVICPNQFWGEHDVRRFFDTIYPRSYEGDAYVTQVGKKVFLTNSNENIDVIQRFSVTVEGVEIRGELGPNSYVIGTFEDRVFLHVNNYPGKVTELGISGVEGEVSSDPPGHVRATKGRGELKLEIKHIGATRVWIEPPRGRGGGVRRRKGGTRS
ncbi:MAG: hypothetical protein JRN44_01905 [Nitrososphaerota archaeon]|nr:hypothetical protein [Nitrososphaerota archaeon]MDG6947259.1 hypothetical protein [Nitrososphaerota archaeon]MDG6955308.1 hypothetical protein [Nitrososphaerota archaeon]